MHEENSREFKQQFKTGYYRITDFGTFQILQFKFCKKNNNKKTVL